MVYNNGMGNIIEQLEAEECTRLQKDIPPFAAGDSVSVRTYVIEGENRRVQAFEGTVIARRGGGLNSSFIVRRSSSGETMERTFQLFSPLMRELRFYATAMLGVPNCIICVSVAVVRRALLKNSGLKKKPNRANAIGKSMIKPEERLKAIVQAAQDLGSGRPFSDIFKNIMKIVQNASGSEGGSLYIYDEKIAKTKRRIVCQ